MNKVLSVNPVEYSGQRYDVEVERNHNYFASGLLVHNCCLPKDTDLKSWNWKAGVFSQIKADGMFANVSRLADGSVVIESRNGSPFPLDAFPGLVGEVKKKLGLGQQLHGEFTMAGPDGKILPRQEGNGLFNKLLKNGELPKGYTPVYEVWDTIPLAMATPKGRCGTDYFTRWENVQAVAKGCKFIKLIECRVVHSLREAYEHYREALKLGLEGVVVKNPNGIWQDTTSKNQVKLKLAFECELKVVGFNAGNGKNADLFGSFQCESSDGKVKVSVTGLSDALRKEIHEDRDGWMGAIITVKANSIMPPERKDYHSLFLPVFEERRLDKKKADDLKKIVAQYEAAIESVTA
jgi:DNA ligase-1